MAHWHASTQCRPVSSRAALCEGKGVSARGEEGGNICLGGRDLMQGNIRFLKDVLITSYAFKATLYSN